MKKHILLVAVCTMYVTSYLGDVTANSERQDETFSLLAQLCPYGYTLVPHGSYLYCCGLQLDSCSIVAHMSQDGELVIRLGETSQVDMDIGKTRPKLCSLPGEDGGIRCRAFIPRYKFDTKEEKCVEFIYGGCHATANNFVTLEECQNKCEI